MYAAQLRTRTLLLHSKAMQFHSYAQESEWSADMAHDMQLICFRNRVED